MTRTLVDASDRWKPLSQLLTELLDRIAAEIPGCVGAALTTGHDGGPLSVLATHGVAERLAPAEVRHGGPIADAAATGDVVTTDDLFADPRWPGLHRDALADRWRQVRGVVAFPGPWDDGGTLVLSAVLDGPVGPEVRAVLARYEKLTADLLVVAEAAAAGDSAQVLAMLASRAAIEQAKGAITALRRCGADEAWNTLRRTSQEFNVKVRDLAVALVEHLGQVPVRQPDGTIPITPDHPARDAARQLWTAFTADRPVGP
ncbi:ANTAR domain-containing protein [Amycolatopsis sp., V23-08]|uniref:ANTAR domain-containing protein n=1 Tax=Amycolatopsis heterodermiae TaxID=3110235 RepID=A0ABU5R2R8_9PSEU|nr:ANTAR domain-containing protein [Amycolatopsis sp., V23-08]MEA5360511.1 ANTAR domain-containing protein [Amycolatopsis sp., V23-08]